MQMFSGQFDQSIGLASRCIDRSRLYHACVYTMTKEICVEKNIALSGTFLKNSRQTFFGYMSFIAQACCMSLHFLTEKMRKNESGKQASFDIDSTGSSAQQHALCV